MRMMLALDDSGYAEAILDWRASLDINRAVKRG